jgi:hypothetical protein
MKYTKEDIINLLNRNQSEGLIQINGTVDQIMGSLDFKEEEMKVEEFMLDIGHSAFKNLMIKRFDFSLFNCKTLSELSTKIIEASESYETYGYIGEEGQNKFKGDLFEIFAEIFFKLTSSDNRVGITDYSVVKDNDDYGVDGVGVALNGIPATIQVKFRSNPTTKMTIKDLKNLHGISYKHYGVPVGTDNNIIIFTNCAGIHWNTQTNVLKNSTLTYGYHNEGSDYNLKNLIDNNTSFWKNLDKMIGYNIDKILGDIE